MFARAAHLVVDKCGLKMEDVAVIGSHGSVNDNYAVLAFVNVYLRDKGLHPLGAVFFSLSWD